MGIRRSYIGCEGATGIALSLRGPLLDRSNAGAQLQSNQLLESLLAYWDVPCDCYQGHPFCGFVVVDARTHQRYTVLLWPLRFTTSFKW